MSKDHWPLCIKERKRIESLGGYIDDGYLNDQLGMKEINGKGEPLSAEPKIKLITLTKEDEFFIIGNDGI
ncbi:hypothetical protein JHK82_055165 [Glycine max]|uniref:PPM-type phosphatase domain-containing protein n=1 Tax=Glycine max TaxID=3847 RepID=K7N179_SOYBN|nr:hypothetical protein JHK86_055006 [Glycine max]KAG4917698.1 hypothetical protein JHK85_055979 [Glycine max]KAG5073796.1 hypothetical protein JHK84_055027 [Glycine max]KAG5076470.1 hypothetical protein JHK82_055165 [Glycine max]